VLRPKARWYWLSAIPFVLGLVAMTVFIVLAVKAFPGDPDEFTAPGGPTLTLEEGEKKTIYRQTSGFGASTAEPRCRVVDAATERPLELDEAGSFTFTTGGDEYAAELHFEAPSAGSYEVDCAGPFGGSEQALAVGDRVSFGSFGLAIGGAIAAPLLGFLISVVMAIIVAVRRNRHKKRLQEEAASA
jgi:hypothetical protein